MKLYWTIVIGPLQDALQLADLITDLGDVFDNDYDESPNGVGLNPTYSLLFGKFEERVEAERIASLIKKQFGLDSIVSLHDRNVDVGDNHKFSTPNFIEKIYSQYIEGVSLPSIYFLIDEGIKEYPSNTDAIRRGIFSKFKDVEIGFAIPFGLDYIRNVDDIRFLKVLLTRMKRNGMYNEVIELLLHKYNIEGQEEIRDILLPMLFEHRLHEIVQDETDSIEMIIERLAEILNDSVMTDIELFQILFIGLRGRNEYKDLRIEIAKRYGKMWSPDSDIECELALIEFQSGDIRGPIAKLEKYGNSERWKKHLDKMQSHRILLDEGWVFPPRAPNNPHAIPGLVRYLAYTSVPYHTSGYATRTHNLLRALHELECNVECVTRYSYPWVDFKLEGDAVESMDVIDGIPYHRQSNDVNFLSWTLEKRLQVAIESLVEHCEKEGVPELLHAASNWMNGLTAIHAGRILGIPVVYEVRGLWELTRVAKDPNFEDSEHFQMIARMELEVAMAADSVIAITDGLRSELIERGVDENKINVAPNGVDPKRFQHLDKDRELADELGLPDGPVVGYVGSLVRYEGLHLLLEAVSKLSRNEQWKGSVLIVGDGECRNELEILAKELNIAEICYFTGKVDFRDVDRYYSLIDIAPFPRLPLKVCELVSPLKPFEAMAMGTPVITSDVAAMKEFITPNENGLLFRKGDADSLAEVLSNIISSPNLIEKIGSTSRKWVTDNRTWIHTAQAITSIHNSVKMVRRPTILIAGHDLKFIYEMGREFVRRGYVVLEDKWNNHTSHDVSHSQKVLAASDVVICEWALGNTKWYSENVKSHQRLYIRFHRQEIDTDFPFNIQWNAVNNIVFIAPLIEREAIEKFAIPKEKSIYIPNAVDTLNFDLPKSASSQRTLGLMGMVPKMKRFDRALDILSIINSQGGNFNLRVKGKMPEDYDWMKQRKDEMEWYEHQLSRIENESELSGRVHFDGWGNDVEKWLSNVGYILSVSDFEGSHQAVAEGVASGAIPIIIKWKGADEVYPRKWCVNTIEKGAEKILSFSSESTFEEREMERIKIVNNIRENFDLTIIVERWLTMMGLN